MDTYTYVIGNNCYVNLTNRCTNRCTFCVRNGKQTFEGYDLWLKEGEPTAEQVEAGIGDPARYTEVVFCGFGEPTYRLDVMLAVCDWVHAHGGKTRLNTNGHGSIINHETGDSTSYGLYNAQERGRLFIGPGVPVYEGQIIGECARNEDLVVAATKKKHVTNMRAAGSDEALRLTPPTILSLEQCLEFIAEDELVEVTPKNIRMRKKILSKEQRMKKAARAAAEE